jgi:ribose/xylose/arabinose/galactoside ABC-type transport system permease subunit
MLEFGYFTVAGVPLPVIVFALVVLAAWVVLTRTQFGRQIYAVGNDADAAHKAASTSIGSRHGSTLFPVLAPRSPASC